MASWVCLPWPPCAVLLTGEKLEIKLGGGICRHSPRDYPTELGGQCNEQPSLDEY